MSTQVLVERILADAKTEADAIVAEAEAKAEKIIAEATARAEKYRQATEAEVGEKCKSILEKRAAAARLDSAKVLLREKRRVLDAIYDEALSRLLELSKEESVKLIASLLACYAEEGDEIVFAKNFPYASEVKLLPIVAEKGLIVAEKTEDFSGGIRLRGKISDKDLSYGALLFADREENQAKIAAELFK